MTSSDQTPQQKLNTLRASLLQRQHSLRRLFMEMYGDDETFPHQRLHTDAALREIGSFPRSEMQDDFLLAEVYRGQTLKSVHLYLLPMHGPLWLPLEPGDTVLSFHDHGGNRAPSPSGQSDSEWRVSDFLKVIAIE